MRGPESFTRSVRNFTLGVAAATLAAIALNSDGSSEEHRAEVTEQSVEIVPARAQTCLLTPNLRSVVKLDIPWNSPDADLSRISFGVIDVNLGPPDAISKYAGDVAADYDLCLKDITAAVSRTVESTPASQRADNESDQQEAVDLNRYRASDEEKAVVKVNRTSLRMNRPRVNFPAEDIVYEVKDGYIVERQGKPVEPPELAFASDGTYVIEQPHQRGQDSGLADLYEAISFGKIDIGKEAIDTLNTAEQLAVANPACIDAIIKDVSLDEMIKASLLNGLSRESGFAPDNVKVEFIEGTQWPNADKLLDENGQTFAEKQAAFKQNIPGDWDLRFAADCTAAVVRPSIDR